MTTTQQAPPTHLRMGVSVACLVAGALFGLVSVLSNSRAACAAWVLLALVLTFVSGLVFPSLRLRA
jgi:hypothetical protein